MNLRQMNLAIIMTSSVTETPIRYYVFILSEEQKIKKIESYFKEVMETLRFNLDDDSLNGTPHRVAKMYVKEIFNGLNHDVSR